MAGNQGAGPLAFDPIERASLLWSERIGDATAMRVVTSVMRVQQLLLTRIDALLKPFGLTFARYEVLVLLAFSRAGELSLSRIGERLQVHPTSVTNAIARLEAAGFVTRVTDPADRRRAIAGLTPAGREAMERATEVLQEDGFGLEDLNQETAELVWAGLRTIRLQAGDFADG